MYVKDMPSVASARLDEDLAVGHERPRVKLDLPLTGMAGDDRLAAAYAIVELGKRGPKNCEFTSTDGEEDLDTDEVEQLVPRSPEYRRQDRNRRRQNHGGSADSSPARTPTNKPLQMEQPARFNHVRLAVMPSRISGKGVERLPPKRKLLEDDEDLNSGIKAKLARMLFEKQCSRSDKSELGGGRDDTYGNKDAAICIDEDSQSNSCSVGKFVRTSVPLIDSVTSYIQSPAGCVVGGVKVEVCVGEETLNENQVLHLDEKVLRPETSFDSYQGVKDEGLTPEVEGIRNSQTNDVSVLSSEQRPSSSDCEVKRERLSSVYEHNSPAISAFLHNIPYLTMEDRRNRVSASNQTVSSPHRRHAFDESVHSPEKSNNLRFSGRVSNGTPFQIVNVLVPGLGLMPYAVLPSDARLPADHTGFPVERTVPPKEDTSSDAMKKLEAFGRRAFANVLPDSEANNQKRLPLARKFYPQFGSLNSISNYYTVGSSSPVDGSSSPVDGRGFQSSPNEAYRSWQDLTSIPSDAEKLVNFNRSKMSQLPLHPRASHHLTQERLQSIKTADKDFAVHRVERKTEKSRRKVTSVDPDVLEVIRAGEFGTLRSIQNYYNGMKSKESSKTLTCGEPSRVLMDRSSDSVMQRRLPDGFPIKHEQVEVQDVPLDLSRCEKEHTTDLKCEPYLHSSFINRDNSTGLADFHCSGSRAEKETANCSDDTSAPACNTRPEMLTNNSRVDVSVDLKSQTLANSRLPPKKRKLYLSSEIHESVESETTHSALSSAALSADKHDFPNDGPRPEFEKMTLRNDSENCLGSQRTTGKETSAKNLPETRNRSSADSEQNQMSEPKIEAGTSFSVPSFRYLAARDEDGDLPLHIAVAQGLLTVMKKMLPLMLHLGVSVDSYNNSRQTALHLAVISNQPAIVELLLMAGASPNLCDRKGNTAVHLAVKYKSFSCLEQLLTNSRVSLDLNAKNYEGLTALHLGVQLFQRDIVAALLANGASANVMDGTNGRTPLYFAVECNDYVMASLLLRYGSNPCLASYSGCTPLQIATAKSFHDMTSILERSSLRVTDAIMNYA